VMMRTRRLSNVRVIYCPSMPTLTPLTMVVTTSPMMCTFAAPSLLRVVSAASATLCLRVASQSVVFPRQARVEDAMSASR